MKKTATLITLLMTLASPALLPAQSYLQPPMNLVAGGGHLQLQFHGSTNSVYEIEASTNLVNWAGIAQRAGSTGPVTITDPEAGGGSARFYRAVQPDAASTNSPLPKDLTELGLNSYARDKILVKPRPGVDLSGLNLSLSVSVLNVFPAIGKLAVVRVPPAMTPDTLVALYQKSGLVEYAEKDFNLHALVIPNDPLFPDQWGCYNHSQFGGSTNADIDAEDAWGVQHDASNIIVAVVDTGVRYTHQDLAANMWVNPVDGSHGTNVVAGNTDPNDDYGHGTHVAGTIGAVGDNGDGVVGVAWHVQIMACKFLDASGNGTIDGAIACLDYARANGANIVNASWGATGFTSHSLHDAIASLRDAGIMFVAAAGNSGQDNEANPIYPASYADLDNVIAVAATDESDALTSWSNYGLTNVDLATPGALIYSCWNGSDTNYEYLDGTSMACAMTCGAVAVMEAHFPAEDYRQIKQQLLATVDPQPSLQGKCISGGRLNLYKALISGTPPPTLTASFTANPISGQAPLTVQFTDQSTGPVTAWNWDFGDGTTSTAQNPAHIYNSAGSYSATLTVTGTGNQTSSANQMISVTNASSALPVLTVTATQPDAYASGPVPGTVHFHRTGDVSQAYEVYWTFSGTAANGVDYGPLPTNSPFPAGDADADLTITPINHGQTSNATVIVTLAPGSDYQIGWSNSATITIHGISPGPTASFTANPTSGQSPLSVQFTDTSTGSPTNWNWSFGDGATSATQNPSHTYTSAGNYSATLTVTGSSGQTSSASHTITVTNAPAPVTAAFAANPSSGQAPLGVQFTDQSTGPVTAWSWNFGDGVTSTTQNPSHTYSSAGNYSATLTAKGSSGQSSSVSHTITVTNAPPPPTSTITVVASQPLATSLTPGVFSVTRSSSDMSSGLVVKYSLGGTAQNGVDYETLPGAVTIPAGSTTVTVVVQPVGLLNLLKTVGLTISPNSSYTVGSPNSATVEIVASLGL